MESRYEDLIRRVERHRDLIFAAAEHLWKNPETGYKEWKSHTYLKNAYERLGFTLTEAGDIPGFYGELDTGRPGPTIQFMAELDAVKCATHPDCDPETKAVHACGHCCQSAGVLGVAAALSEPGALDGLCGKIRFLEVPAEEALEIGYRESLREQGVIRYFGGKQEFLARGLFEGADLNVLIHTTGTDPAGTGYIIRGGNGFLLKNYTFRGKSAHAAGSPHKGVNALYAATQALTAINALRETFPDSESVRTHPIVTSGGTVVNAIPELVTVENYIRGATVETMIREGEKLDRAVAGSALSLGANVTFRNRPGYLPMYNDPALSAACRDAMTVVLGEGKAKITDKWIGGSSDMGDLAALMPTVYVSVGGAHGKAHGDDYDVSDTETLCVNPAKILVVLAKMLLGNGGEKACAIRDGYRPLYKTKEEYCAALDSLMMDGDAITYREDGTADVRWK